MNKSDRDTQTAAVSLFIVFNDSLSDEQMIATKSFLHHNIPTRVLGSRTFFVGRLRAALLLVRQSAEFLTSAYGNLPRRRLAAFGDAETLRARDGDLKLLLDLLLAAGGAGGVVVAVAVHWRGGGRRADRTGMTHGKLAGRWTGRGEREGGKDGWRRFGGRAKPTIRRRQGGGEMRGGGRSMSMGRRDQQKA